MSFGHEYRCEMAGRHVLEQRRTRGRSERHAALAQASKVFLMILARLDHFADGWRPFQPPLDAGARVADVHDHFIRKPLQHRSQRGLEAFRIGVLVTAIGGEQDELAAQDQRLALRVRQALDGWNL